MYIHGCIYTYVWSEEQKNANPKQNRPPKHQTSISNTRRKASNHPPETHDHRPQVHVTAAHAAEEPTPSTPITHTTQTTHPHHPSKTTAEQQQNSTQTNKTKPKNQTKTKNKQEKTTTPPPNTPTEGDPATHRTEHEALNIGTGPPQPRTRTSP